MSSPPSRTNGQTIDETWFNLVKDDLDSIHSQISLMLTGTVIPWEVQGDYSQTATKIGVMHYLVEQDMTVLGAILHVLANGSAGSTQVDIQRKRGAGGFVSLFTTKPSIPYSAGSNANSVSGTGATAAVIDSVTDELLAGDILRFNFTAVQTNGVGCMLALIVEPTGV